MIHYKIIHYKIVHYIIHYKINSLKHYILEICIVYSKNSCI